MPYSQAIPTGAADRILRNPHLLPRIPSSLSGLIESNKRRERIRQYPEDVHLQCRLKVENERSARIARSEGFYTPTYRRTVSPSPFDAMDEEASATTHTLPRLTRSRSFTLGSTTRQQTSPRSRTRSTSFTTQNGHTHRHRLSNVAEDGGVTNGLYYSPDKGATSDLRLLRSESIASPLLSRRHSFSSHFNTSPSSSKLLTKNPEERLKQRCHQTKRPCPSWKTRDFVQDRHGKMWTSHPSWHRILRSEYRSNGLDRAWRDERNRFLQDFRRDRQFAKQSMRRFSSSF